jgi:hypothetical protein
MMASSEILATILGTMSQVRIPKIRQLEVNSFYSFVKLLIMIMKERSTWTGSMLCRTQTSAA